MFEDFLVTLDSPRNRRRLSPLPGCAAPPPKGEFKDRTIREDQNYFTPACRAGDHFHVPVQVNERKTGLFLVDTGAYSTVLNAAFAKDVTTVLMRPQVGVSGVVGKIPNVMASYRTTLVFSGLKQENDGVVMLDLERLCDDTGSELAGILGRTALDHPVLTLDYQSGLADVAYKQ